MADKVIASQTLTFDGVADSFEQAEAEAAEDLETKMSYVEDLLGSGALTTGVLTEIIKSQQYDLTQLRKENQLLKSKLLKAAAQGFKL